MTVNIRPMAADNKPLPTTLRADERLAKRVAALLACSRREAEQYIEGGWVRVDGQVVEEPQFRVFQQAVEIDKNASLMAAAPVTLLLHKPPGYDDGAEMPAGVRPAPNTALAARQLLQAGTRDPHDPSGIRLLKRHFAALTAPVPLEVGASGLLVFTQDWRVARKLTEDAGVIEHEIIVEIEGLASADTLARLNHGLSSDAGPLPRVKVSVNSAGEGTSKLRFAVKGSHPGLLAYLCQRVNLKILSMKRIRIGRVALSHLPVGQWRYLQTHERF